MSTKQTVRLESSTDRWRYTCPNGHRSWEPTNRHFWCQQCAQFDDEEVEPEFDELHDKKTGELIPRDRVELAHGGVGR